jgi:hypothetical protein
MNDKTKIQIIIVQSAIIGFLLIYLVISLPGEREKELLENRLTQLEQREASCIERNDSLAGVIHEMMITNAIPPFLDERQIDGLKKKGLSDPVEDLKDDLTGHAGLINLQAVHGGKMGFYFRDGITILNERWVFAYFEDGHVAGALLLRYEIEPDGKISWHVLDETSYQD